MCSTVNLFPRDTSMSQKNCPSMEGVPSSQVPYHMEDMTQLEKNAPWSEGVL